MPEPTPAPTVDASRRSLGFVALTVAMVAWSAGTILVKWSSLPGLTFAMFRLWVGAVISVIALLIARRRLSWATFRTCAPGGVLFAADIGVTFVAVNHTSIAHVGVIGALSPVVIAIASTRLLGERLQVRDVVLVALSFVGVAVVVADASGGGVTSAFGDALAFVGIATWSSYWFYSRRVRDRAGPIEYFACVMLAGAVAMTPVALLVEHPTALPTGSDLAAVVSVALVPGFVGHSLVIWSHRYVESWRAAMLTQLSPVLSAVLAWAVLDEPIGAWLAVGGAIVIAASAAVVVSAERRDAAIETPDEVPT
jgi:drug/metabolite transporter (DMT)-like permease